METAFAMATQRLSDVWFDVPKEALENCCVHHKPRVLKHLFINQHTGLICCSEEQPCITRGAGGGSSAQYGGNSYSSSAVEHQRRFQRQRGYDGYHYPRQDYTQPFEDNGGYNSHNAHYVGYNYSVQESNCQQPGGCQQHGYQQPGYHQQPGYLQPGYRQPDYQQPVNQQSGDQQTGYQHNGDTGTPDSESQQQQQQEVENDFNFAQQVEINMLNERLSKMEQDTQSMNTLLVDYKIRDQASTSVQALFEENLKKATAEVKNLKDKAKEKEEQIASMLARVQEQSVQMKDLTDKLQQASAVVQVADQEQNEQLEDFRSKLQQAQSTIEELEKRNNLQNENQNLQIQKALQDSNSMLQREQSAVQELKSQLQQERSLVEELKGQNDVRSQEIKDLNDKLQQVTLEQGHQKNNQTQEIEDLKCKLQEATHFQGQIIDLNGKLLAVKQELLAEHTAATDMLSKTLGVAEAEINKGKDKIRELEKENSDLIVELVQLKTDLKQLKGDALHPKPKVRADIPDVVQVITFEGTKPKGRPPPKTVFSTTAPPPPKKAKTDAADQTLPSSSEAAPSKSSAAAS